jgi:hypothetical protein
VRAVTLHEPVGIPAEPRVGMSCDRLDSLRRLAPSMQVANVVAKSSMYGSTNLAAGYTS